MNLNNIELNLDDPAVREQLKLTDVMGDKKESDADAKEIEAKIKRLRKEATFTCKLDLESIAILERAAAESSMTDWKAYLTKQIFEKIVGQPVASPKISAPSWAGRVTAPSNLNHLDTYRGV